MSTIKTPELALAVGPLARRVSLRIPVGRRPRGAGHHAIGRDGLGAQRCQGHRAALQDPRGIDPRRGLHVPVDDTAVAVRRLAADVGDVGQQARDLSRDANAPRLDRGAGDDPQRQARVLVAAGGRERRLPRRKVGPVRRVAGMEIMASFGTTQGNGFASRIPRRWGKRE